MKKKQIIQMYRDWRKANGNKKPNRAIVKMYWEDESPAEARVDTIALEAFNFNKDDACILFYSSGLKGLLELMNPENGSDFVILEVLEFYKM